MATKKSTGILFAILVIACWVLGSPIQAGAETLNYKGYTWVKKAERVPVGDVEEHAVVLEVREVFMVFENGKVATSNAVVWGDYIKKDRPIYAIRNHKLCRWFYHYS